MSELLEKFQPGVLPHFFVVQTLANLATANGKYSVGFTAVVGFTIFTHQLWILWLWKTFLFASCGKLWCYLHLRNISTYLLTLGWGPISDHPGLQQEGHPAAQWKKVHVHVFDTAYIEYKYSYLLFYSDLLAAYGTVKICRDWLVTHHNRDFVSIHCFVNIWQLSGYLQQMLLMCNSF